MNLKRTKIFYFLSTIIFLIFLIIVMRKEKETIQDHEEESISKCPKTNYKEEKKYFDRFETITKGQNLVRYKESRLAHKLLDGLKGLEIGASAHNPYGLDTLNIDFAEKTIFQAHQLSFSKELAKVHIVSPGDQLPFTNNSIDFVINSHVLEHFFDPIKAIKEWLRVVKCDGYVYMDIPHKDRTPDNIRNRTTLAELLKRQKQPEPNIDKGFHHSVWITEDVLELCNYFNWKVVEWRNEDDKTTLFGKPAIGFTIVIQKTEFCEEND